MQIALRLLALVFVGLLILGLLALGSCAIYVGTLPTFNERKQAEIKQFYRQHAADWGAFCQEYRCEDIPQGFVVKSLAEQTYLLPHTSYPITEGECRVATDSRDATEYDDQVFQRGASLDIPGMAYYTQCERDGSTARYWENTIRTHKGYVWLREPSVHSSLRELLGPGPLSGAPAPTYRSRLELTRPITADFLMFETETLASRRVYLSTERLFQGRHIALTCTDRCDLQTVVFDEDKDLTTLHVEEMLQFTRYGYQCALFEVLWTCGPPMEEQLASMARYVRFLDAELNKARRPPLSAR